jgi:tetratricopeptide (TPR) repeat protein
MTDQANAPRKARRRAAPVGALPDTPDPIEIAMIAAASGKPLPGPALNVLEKHARLIDCQAELAKAQCSELKLRKVGEGVRAVLWGTLAIAAFGVIALIGAIFVRASGSDALIVQSFRVPPRLEARGLKGEVVATQVLDKLADMQGRTKSVRAASTYANNWDDELKIDIPNTGASTDQVWKLLRGWLGKETRISGEVIEIGDDLALTARVGSSPGQRFQSPSADFDGLITKGAELIYRQTQPYRYAVYLARTGREAEQSPIFHELTAHASPMERKWAYSGLSLNANSRGDFRASVKMAARALAIDPSMAPALANGAQAHQSLGHDQLALDMRLLSYKQKPDRAEYDPSIAATNRCDDLFAIAQLLREPRTFDDAAVCYETHEVLDVVTPAYARSGAAFLRHDPDRAETLAIKSLNSLPAPIAEYFKASMQLAVEMDKGASPALATALDNYRKVAVLPASAGSMAKVLNAAAPTSDWPGQAEVLLMLGSATEAQALIGRTPLDCYNCVRVRGLTAQAMRDPSAAQRWFTEAVRQGPRIPTAYVDWGRFLTQHRRFDDAQVRFAKAAELAPNWADPLKYWGDALVAQGKHAEAKAKYDAAAELAPKWEELRRASARLLRRA